LPSNPSDSVGSRRFDLPSLALFVIALALLGIRPLWEPDEGRYADVALEMLRDGDWLTPMLHHEVVHFTKPPLFYWLAAVPSWLFGASEWALRLPSALAFAVTVLLVARIARRLLPGHERAAAVVQATSLLPFVAASLVTTDSVLTMWETLAMSAYVDLRFAHGGARARWLFWLSLAGAFLTKGPPGLLPLLAIAAFAVWQRRSGAPSTAPRLAAWGPLTVFLLLSLGWFAVESLTHPALACYWLRDEVLGRVVTGEHHRNPGLIGLLRVYVPVVLLGALPWLAVPFVRRRHPPPPLEPGVRRFLLAWLLAPAIVFAISSSHMPLYLLPLSAPASLLLARWLPAQWSPRARLALAAWALALLALRVIPAAIDNPRDGRRFAEALAPRLPVPPTEIVFIDARPRYSLSLYLGTEVEWVRLDLPPSDPDHAFEPQFSSLEDEIQEPEPGRYFLVPEGRKAAFLAALAGLRESAREIGQVEDFAIFDNSRPSG
jgi:4-amino-4-deoxy-L-arabinose transferase-like glycosyltransferase